MTTKKAELCKKLFLFANGETAASPVREDNVAVAGVLFRFNGGEDYAIEPSRFPDNIRNLLVFHGIKQALGDSYAGAADVDEATERFLAKVEQYESGKWTDRGDTGPRIEVIAQALARVRPDKYADLDVARAEVRGWSEEARTAKLKIPQLIAAIEAIKAERAAERAKKAAEAAGTATPDGAASL